MVSDSRGFGSVKASGAQAAVSPTTEVVELRGLYVSNDQAQAS